MNFSPKKLLIRFAKCTGVLLVLLLALLFTLPTLMHNETNKVEMLESRLAMIGLEMAYYDKYVREDSDAVADTADNTRLLRHFLDKGVIMKEDFDFLIAHNAVYHPAWFEEKEGSMITMPFEAYNLDYIPDMPNEDYMRCVVTPRPPEH